MVQRILQKCTTMYIYLLTNPLFAGTRKTTWGLVTAPALLLTVLLLLLGRRRYKIYSSYNICEFVWIADLEINNNYNQFSVPRARVTRAVATPAVRARLPATAAELCNKLHKQCNYLLVIFLEMSVNLRLSQNLYFHLHFLLKGGF